MPLSRLVLLVLLAPIAAQPGRAAEPACRAIERGAGPPPTEHWLDDDAEERNGRERTKWIEAMHRAAPGTDWRAIERANGAEAMARRALLLRRKDYVADTWTERGSRNQAGRMHCVALSLDGTTLYAGSDRGGVWRASPDGTGWTAIGDSLWGGAHQVAVASTPSGQAVLALTSWGRLAYTLDDGLNWLVPAGLPALDGGKRLIADPADRSRVFCVARAGSWRLLRSLDGGLSWTSVRTLAAAGDAWMDRVAGGRIWLLEGAELWTSDTLGDTWSGGTLVTGGAIDDAVLAGSEAGAPTLHAALHRAGGGWERYRSDTAGSSWIRMPDPAEFWGQLDASMSDPGLVAQGGVEVWRSANGGATEAVVNAWSDYYGNPAARLHADLFGLDVLRIGGVETWFVSTDGGIYASQDGLATVRNICLQGLGVSQYYSTLTSRLDPARILAGAQDQGYQRASVAGAPTADFEQLISGDYGHLTSPDGTHAFVVSTYPGFILVQQGEDAPALDGLDFPPGAQHQWLPAVVADPAHPSAFYFCGDRLWRHELSAGTWATERGTQDFTGSGATTVTKLSIAPSDPALRLAVTDAGTLWWSDDSGGSWTRSADDGPGAHYFYGTALEHSPDDPLTAIVGGSGYSGPAIWRTTDGGRTWSPFADGLPRTLVYDVAWQGPGSAVAFAATEAGPYRLDPFTGAWEWIGGTEAPLTTYWSVETVESVGVARFGTYGRGIWDWQFEVVPESRACADSIDNDGNGLVDCADPGCAVADTDADGHADCGGSDCAPRDASTWSVPGDVALLRVARVGQGADARLTWSDDQLVGAGPGTVHDVAAGSLAVLRSAGWPASAVCLRNDAPGLSHDDPTAGLGAIWYLVRAQNACGFGPWGAGEAGPAVLAGGCR